MPLFPTFLLSYWQGLAVVGGAVLVVMALAIVYVLRLNARLRQSRHSLQQEVTERRRAEAELRRLSSIVEHTADSVMMTDPQGTIEYVNSSFERLSGYSRAEVTGARASVLKSGCHAAEFYQRLWSTVLDGGTFHAVFLNRHKDGSLFYEEKTVFALKDEEGVIHHLVSTGKDITESRLAEERMRQHESKLAHLARISTMGEMAAAIAHELNQPLAAISNYAQGCVRRLAVDAMDRGELQAALENIASQAQRSGAVLRRMRGFIQKRDMQFAYSDINALVGDALELARPEARERQVELELQLGEPLRPVLADVLQIQQVVLNLVRNAIDAVSGSQQTAGKVTIRTGALANGAVEVAVEDNGPGFLANETEQLFEAFWTTKEQGMGMGLTISRSIVEAHNGRLVAVPRPGGGSRFSFTLPTEDRRRYQRPAAAHAGTE